MQIVPEIVTKVSHLTIFQRTPNWIIPRLDAPVSPLQQALLTCIPPLLWRKRSLQMDYREAFHDGIFDNDSEFANRLRGWGNGLRKAQLADHPELCEKLTPNYAPGCKRVIKSDDYYPALTRDNVSLETRPITRITDRGIEVEGGLQEYDLIVLATGFRTVDFMYPIKVYGTNGRPIEEIWKDGARAYRGVTVEDMPNFGMLYGPNTNLGEEQNQLQPRRLLLLTDFTVNRTQFHYPYDRGSIQVPE